MDCYASGDLAGFASAQDWAEHAVKIDNPSRPIRIALPCAGMMGSNASFAHTGCPHTAVNVYDNEGGYKKVTEYILFGKGIGNIGENEGDIVKTSLTTLAHADLVVGGPPCPSWAGNGSKASSKDVRSAVFDQVLRWIIYLDKAGGLLGFILENVFGITAGWEGCEPWLDACIRQMSTWLPTGTSARSC